MIESHRGIEGDVPENSWPAIKLGHQLGADLIEVDIQLSWDGVAFLRHNYQLSDGRWCHDKFWEDLKDLKIEDELLPLLEDVLVWAAGCRRVFIFGYENFFQIRRKFDKRGCSSSGENKHQR